MGALLEFQTGGSDTAALGGDLAYQYGLNGSLTGVGYGAAQNALNDANFGAAPQTLNTTTAVYSGVARLA